MSEWYYNQDGKPVGPIEEAVLIEWISGKTVQPSQLIRKEGQETWQEARAYPELWKDGPPPAPIAATSLGTRSKVRKKSRWIRRVIILLVVLLLLGWFMWKVVLGEQVSGPVRFSVQFSPDSTKFAYLWFKAGIAPLPHGPFFKEKVQIRWARIDNPDNQHSIEVDSMGPEFPSHGTPLFWQAHCMFSPDSRYIAVVTSNSIKVIDTDTGACRDLGHPGELVKSLVWLNSYEIRYSSYKYVTTNEPRKSSLTLWHQDIRKLPDARVLIAGPYPYGSLMNMEMNWEFERWSPSGRYVMLRYSDGEADKHLILDTVTGGTTSCGPWWDLSWKRDESAVTLFSRPTGEPKNYNVKVLSLPSGPILDISEQFNRNFSGFQYSQVDPLWTADGLYMLFDTREKKVGVFLVRPEPWGIARLSVKGPSTTAWAGLLLDNEYSDNRLVDYSGQVVVNLGAKGVISPDRKWAIVGDPMYMSGLPVPVRIDLPHSAPASMPLTWQQER